MSHETLQVEGMTCDHCAKTVTQAVQTLTGVHKVTVDLGGKRVSVDFDEGKVGVADISAKITEVGFEVIEK